MLIRTTLILLALGGPALADMAWAQTAGPSQVQPTAPERPGFATQQQLQSEVSALAQRIQALESNINARFDEKDKAVAILQVLANKEPSASNVQLQVQQVKALFEAYQAEAQKEREAIRTLNEAKFADLMTSNRSQDELAEARYKSTQEAIILARENADKALTTALTGQKELLSAALATANEQVGRVEKTNAERFAAVNTALDRLLAERGDLPNKREIEIQFIAMEQRIRDIQAAGDKAVVDTNSRLQLALDQLQRASGASESNSSLWSIIGIVIGGLGVVAGVAIALTTRKPHEVHYTDNGRSRS
jgi:hypothetical protein